MGSGTVIAGPHEFIDIAVLGCVAGYCPASTVGATVWSPDEVESLPLEATTRLQVYVLLLPPYAPLSNVNSPAAGQVKVSSEQ